MIPTIKKPTRVTRKTATVIDHILTNQFINANFNPNKAGLFEGNFSWEGGDQFDHPLHISRRTYLSSI